MLIEPLNLSQGSGKVLFTGAVNSSLNLKGVSSEFSERIVFNNTDENAQKVCRHSGNDKSRSLNNDETS
jgi:hypothetical protein